MFTTTLDCLLRSKGKKAFVVTNGPITFTFRIFSYCSGDLQAAICENCLWCMRIVRGVDARRARSKTYNFKGETVTPSWMPALLISKSIPSCVLATSAAAACNTPFHFACQHIRLQHQHACVYMSQLQCRSDRADALLVTASAGHRVTKLTLTLSSRSVSNSTNSIRPSNFAASSPRRTALSRFLAVATTLLWVVSSMVLARLNPRPLLHPVITTTVLASKAKLGAVLKLVGVKGAMASYIVSLECVKVCSCSVTRSAFEEMRGRHGVICEVSFTACTRKHHFTDIRSFSSMPGTQEVSREVSSVLLL